MVVYIFFWSNAAVYVRGRYGPGSTREPGQPEPAHISRFGPVHRFDLGKKTKEPNKSGSGVGFQIS